MKKLVPETIHELEHFRMEIADEFGVNNPKYDDNLISRDLRSIDIETIKHMPWHHDYFL